MTIKEENVLNLLVTVSAKEIDKSSQTVVMNVMNAGHLPELNKIILFAELIDAKTMKSSFSMEHAKFAQEELYQIHGLKNAFQPPKLLLKQQKKKKLHPQHH